MGIIKNKSVRALILIMSALALIGISIARTYYKNINKSVDPRVIEAREIYERYNTYGAANDFDGVFALMDSIEHIYSAFEHYKASYETGVLYNNRAATYLTMAFYHDDYKHDSTVIDSLVNLSETASLKSIELYEDWLSKYDGKDEIQVQSIMNSNFLIGLEEYTAEEHESFIEKRVAEIMEAQFETKRRLSVSHTNLGVVYRHRGQYDEAVKQYSKAIELWDQNLTAENNLNMLLGKPLKKRTFIQKLFPPERN